MSGQTRQTRDTVHSPPRPQRSSCHLHRLLSYNLPPLVKVFHTPQRTLSHELGCKGGRDDHNPTRCQNASRLEYIVQVQIKSQGRYKATRGLIKDNLRSLGLDNTNLLPLGHRQRRTRSRTTRRLPSLAPLVLLRLGRMLSRIISPSRVSGMFRTILGRLVLTGERSGSFVGGSTTTSTQSLGEVPVPA
jgi:hypothetical protein